MVDGGLRVAGHVVASWQRGSSLPGGRSDGFPAFYQFHYLVGFPGQVAVGSERIIPSTVGAENEFFLLQSTIVHADPANLLVSKYSILPSALAVSLIVFPIKMLAVSSIFLLSPSPPFLAFR